MFNVTIKNIKFIAFNNNFQICSSLISHHFTFYIKLLPHELFVILAVYGVEVEERMIPAC